MRPLARASIQVTCLLLVILSSAAPVRADADRFAIVIGNNRPERAGRPQLRYADDDAVATHRLLREAGVSSRLLVTLDRDSKKLYPGCAKDGSPVWGDLERALADLRRLIQQARSKGRESEFYFVYSGHGEVAHGEGYILLEDRRLTRTLLWQILAKLPTSRNHVVVDACKSFYLAFEKGPGGERVPYHRSFVRRSAPARLANTGFVLSTSSDRDSHEWERYQAGVFSHEVRSALRGGADADGDRRITYAELGAFLRTANRSIPNPRFRPDFIVRPPGDLSRQVLSWRRESGSLVLDEPSVGHVYVEAASGERLLDVHPERELRLALHLPSQRPLFVRRADGSREHIVKRPRDRLSRIQPTPLTVARRGAVHLAFERLFAEPFGGRQVRAYAAWHEKELARAGRSESTAEPGVGVTRRLYRIAHELDVGVGYISPDHYTTSMVLSGGYAWHITGTWALEARFSYFVNFQTDLRDKLEHNFGVHEQRFDEMLYFGQLGGIFKPFYGELGRTLAFELFFSASALVGVMNEGGRGPQTWRHQRRTLVGGAPGVGIRCFLHDNISLRLDLRQLLISAGDRFLFPQTVTFSLGLATRRGDR
jgi:outer membrane beta-barrel protein